jgi:hypothetical protein
MVKWSFLITPLLLTVEEPIYPIACFLEADLRHSGNYDTIVRYSSRDDNSFRVIILFHMANKQRTAWNDLRLY